MKSINYLAGQSKNSEMDMDLLDDVIKGFNDLQDTVGANKKAFNLKFSVAVGKALITLFDDHGMSKEHPLRHAAEYNWGRGKVLK